MKVVGSIVVFISSAFVLCEFIVACTSVPTPQPVVSSFAQPNVLDADHFRQGNPEADAAQVLKAKGETYLQICEQVCSLPGFFGDEAKRAKGRRVEKVPGIDGPIRAEQESYFEAANDFANRFNREMLKLTSAPN